MTDYIKRSTAIELMKKGSSRNDESFEELGGESGIYAEAYEDAANMLQDMPAADVAPVVHGEWLRTDDDWNSLTTIQCSLCSEEWCFETDDDVSLLNYKYCPHCGAKMDGGDTDGGKDEDANE